MTEAVDMLGSPRAAAAVMGLRRSRRGVGWWLLVVVGGVIWVGVMAAAIQGGLKLRGWMWDQTDSIRFRGDIQNAIYWGNQVLEKSKAIPAEAPAGTWRGQYEALWQAYVGFYDGLTQSHAKRGMQLDYAPVRLAVAVLWAKQISELPGDKHHPWDRGAIEFMLRINTALELLAAAAMFGLVFYWVRREDRSEASRLQLRNGRGIARGWVLASLAGLLVWFNPAALVNAHVWPQWDIVAVAFFLMAALALSLNGCLTAGVLLAIGGMWKGQVLMVAPLLLFWPLFEGKWRRSLRLLAGFVGGAGLLASPWLASNWGAWVLVGAMTLGAAIGSWWLFRSWRNQAALVMGVLGAGLFAAGFWMGGSFGWFETGFVFGANQWQAMNMGATINLPALMHRRWKWGLNDVIVGTMTVKWFLLSIYAATLILCAAGAARHSRRNSVGVLIALAAPWVLMFALVAQLHERYLMWGAVMTAAFVAVSFGMTLLHLLTTALAVVPMMLSLLSHDPKFAPKWLVFIRGLNPDIGWMVLLLAAIYLYLALVNRPRLRAPEC